MTTLSDPSLWPSLYGDTLYRHALFRLRDEMAAEEVVQETFLAALQARDRFAGNAAEKSWLIAILKHKIVDHLRKVIRERPYEDETLLADALEQESFDSRGHWQIDVARWANPDNSLEQEQFWRTLNDCIKRLPPRMATLFIMREIDGLESETICQELALSTTNNLWTLLSRMRMRLRQCLEQNWFGK